MPILCSCHHYSCYHYNIQDSLEQCPTIASSKYALINYWLITLLVLWSLLGGSVCYGRVVTVGGEVLENGREVQTDMPPTSVVQTAMPSTSGVVQTAMPSTSGVAQTAVPSTSVVVPGKAVQIAMPSTSLTLLLMTFLLIISGYLSK